MEFAMTKFCSDARAGIDIPTGMSSVSAWKTISYDNKVKWYEAYFEEDDDEESDDEIDEDEMHMYLYYNKGYSDAKNGKVCCTNEIEKSIANDDTVGEYYRHGYLCFKETQFSFYEALLRFESMYDNRNL
jgi:hypothetical protein